MRSTRSQEHHVQTTLLTRSQFLMQQICTTQTRNHTMFVCRSHQHDLNQKCWFMVTLQADQTRKSPYSTTYANDDLSSLAVLSEHGINKSIRGNVEILNVERTVENYCQRKRKNRRAGCRCRVDTAEKGESSSQNERDSANTPSECWTRRNSKFFLGALA